MCVQTCLQVQMHAYVNISLYAYELIIVFSCLKLYVRTFSRESSSWYLASRFFLKRARAILRRMTDWIFINAAVHRACQGRRYCKVEDLFFNIWTEKVYEIM